MSLSTKQLENLSAALRGEAVLRAPAAETPNQRYHVGAVWYGDWRRGDGGGRFGSDRRPRHNACLTRRDKEMQYFRLAPVTSEAKRGGKAVALPAGAIPGGEYCVSYVLTKVHLIATRATLDDGGQFTYKCNLSQELVQAIKEAMRR